MSRDGGGPDDAGVAADLAAHGFSRFGDPSAVRRGLAGPLRGQDRVREIRRRSRQSPQKARRSPKGRRGGGGAPPRNGPQIARRRGAARRRGGGAAGAFAYSSHRG